MWLLEVVLSAVAQAESSNDGCDSGDSARTRQPVMAGSVTAGAPASCAAAARLPEAVGCVATGAPFQVTSVMPLPHASRSAGVFVSPVRFSVPALIDAVRTSSGPRTITGPLDVSSRHSVDTASSSAICSSSGCAPPILTCSKPLIG